MKKYITLLSIILFIASCDVLEGPYDTTEDCAGIIGGDNICGCTDSLAFNYNIAATFEDESCIYDTATTYIKKILIEDFTGHLCPNCPGAARELEAIHDIYGDQIIGMALHVSKAFGRPYPASAAPKFQYDFRTEWGAQWDDFFGISDQGLPRGMVNRIGYPDNHILGINEWATAVASELEKEIDFGITISSTSNSIDINTEVLNSINGSYNLVVCLTESNIINWQKDGANEVENYEHNHVLRTVLADEALTSSTTYNLNDIISKSYSYDLTALENYNINYSTNNTAELGNGNSGGWNASNLSIIAYIYDVTSHEIVQVEEVHLSTK